MDTILITGSPGSGKTTTANCLSEIFREQNIHHIVIDPDETARVFPEDSLSQLKMDTLTALQPLYANLGVEKIIMPMTIDDNNDLEIINTIFGKEKIKIFNLIVAEHVSVKRVVEREPNEYWQNKLSKIVKTYHRNESARTFECNDIDAKDRSVLEVAQAISNSELRRTLNTKPL